MNISDSFAHRMTLTDFTIPFVSFGVLLGGAMIAAETQMDLGLARTVYSIWVATVLVTPALCAFALPGNSDRIKHVWLLFWTFSLVAYLVHASYAFFSIYDGSTHEFLIGQGTPAAIVNLMFTLWWILDVLLSWFFRESRWIRIERVAAHIFIGLTFVVSTVFLKHGFINILGIVLTVSVVVCLMIRFDAWRDEKTVSAAL